MDFGENAMAAENGNKIDIFDSTLRDGAQGEGINFSVQDKIHIAQALDELGVSFVEAGNPGSNPKDMEFFQEMKSHPLKNAVLCAFGATRRKDTKCGDDANLRSLLAAGTKCVVVFGKSWKFQVTEIIKTTLEENLAMIRETCAFLAQNGRDVIYDAEHFFTGFMDDREYAMRTLEAALEGGASVLDLCETKGGCLVDDAREITRSAVDAFGARAKIGMHAHNDSGLAVAISLAAAQAGARHIQGTLLGFGERAGNANLSTIIPNLQLKMGFECLGEGRLEALTPIAKRVAEIANIATDSRLPYIGANAFAHKAGMHIDAVIKNPAAYEHIEPEAVGNSRVFLMSEVAGRSMVFEKIKKMDPSIKKDDDSVKKIMARMKTLEARGWQFEGADGSFELLARKMLGRYRPFFTLHYYQTSGINPRPEEGVNACAQIKVEVDGQIEVTAGEGDGPVNALDIALRKALSRFYPAVEKVRLTDYKVRVIDGRSATAAKVRVLIESADGASSWSTVGVSSDIMEASWLALVDSFEYKLIKDMERHFKT